MTPTIFRRVTGDQTVVLKVKIDCEGCERRVRRALEGMKGVKDVAVDAEASVVHRTGKRAELWPYVPYDVVAHPYAQGVYDKKAPPGYVHYADDPHVSNLARASSTEVRYTTAFSDENPAACAVMDSLHFISCKNQEWVSICVVSNVSESKSDGFVLSYTLREVEERWSAIAFSYSKLFYLLKDSSFKL